MKKTSPTLTARPQKNRILLIVASLMIGSGILRIGHEFGSAIANQPGLVTQDAKDQSKGDSEKTRMAELLARLQEREAALTQREKDIFEREQAAQKATVEAQQKLIALEMAEEKLRKTLSGAEGAAEKDLARLTSMFETMKPKKAAELFSEMAPNFAAGFLARMEPEAAARVLSGLRPETAYSISVFLAGRNTSVPKN